MSARGGFAWLGAIAIAVACGGETAQHDSGDAAGGGLGGGGGVAAGGSGGVAAGGSGGVAAGGSGGVVAGGSGGVAAGGSGGVAAGGSGGVAAGGSGGVEGGLAGGGSGGSGGSGGTTVIRLGRACLSDSECGSGLTCVTASSGAFAGEGPAKGYCTTSCLSTPTLCAQFAPKAVCHSFSSGSAYCLQGCSFGPVGSSSFDPAKCHGRQEIACSPEYQGSTLSPVCLPRCNADSDCGSGSYCNPRSGLCGTSMPTGKSLGEACSTTPPETCEGVCQDLEHSNGQVFTSLCMEGCTHGATPACGWAGPGTGPAGAACLYADPVVAKNGGPSIGDLGRCGLLCDCNSQCKNPALTCVAWSGANAAQVQSFFGRAGYCGDPLGGDAGVNPGLPTCP